MPTLMFVDLVVDPCEDRDRRWHSKRACGQGDDLLDLFNRDAHSQGLSDAGMYSTLTHGSDRDRKFDQPQVLVLNRAFSSSRTDVFPCVRQFWISPHERFVSLWWFRT